MRPDEHRHACAVQRQTQKVNPTYLRDFFLSLRIEPHRLVEDLHTLLTYVFIEMTSGKVSADSAQFIYQYERSNS